MPEPDRSPKHLPSGLTETVGVVEAILGQVVAAAEGEALFDVVEAIRQEMLAFREADSEARQEAALDAAAGRLAELSVADKTALARAYTLYLQLVNVCENAYRTHRLRDRLDREESSEARARLTFVLTAHPTESRSPDNIRVLRRVQDHVVDSLAGNRPVDRDEVENLLHLAWKVGTHPPRKPSVEDEANHLFSLLTDPILAEVIALTEDRLSGFVHHFHRKRSQVHTCPVRSGRLPSNGLLRIARGLGQLLPGGYGIADWRFCRS